MIRLSRAHTVLAAIGAASALAAGAAVPAMHAVSASSGPPSCRGAGHWHCPSSTPTSPIPGGVSSSPAPSPAGTSTSPLPTTPDPSPTAPAPTLTSPSPSPTTPTTPTAWAWCSSDTNGFHQFGSLSLFNGEWNSTLPQVICGNSASDWQVSSSQPTGQTGIMTYPDVQLNYNTSQPLVSGLNPAATSSFAESMNTNPGTSAEAGYDIWLDVPGNTSRAEVMIWYDTFNRGTVGGAAKLADPVTFCGQDWELWHYGSELIWYLPQNEQTGTVCPVQMLQWLQSHGYLSAGASLSQFENGWEIASTGGAAETFRMTTYSVSGLPAGN